MACRVLADDNFRYMDASQRVEHGEYATYGEAFAVCKEIVDRFLRHECVPGMPARTLYFRYIMFGRDPFIVCGEHGTDAQPGFSAWEYAKARCVDLCGEVLVSAPEDVALTA
jgi:hypothetical protein